MELKKSVRLFYLSGLLAVLSFIALLCMQIAVTVPYEKERIFNYSIGAMFWIGIITSQTSFWFSNAVIKKSMEAEEKSTDKLGIICFFQNKAASVFDVILLASVIATAVCSGIAKNNIGSYISIALLFFSFYEHCLWNGRNFKYIKTLNTKRKRSKEKDE